MLLGQLTLLPSTKNCAHSTPHRLGHREKRHNEGKRTEFSSLRSVPMIYVHYASSRTKCICFHGEEMPEGSPLRLVATFNDDEVALSDDSVSRL